MIILKVIIIIGFYSLIYSTRNLIFSPSTQALNDLINDLGGSPICTKPVVKNDSPQRDSPQRYDDLEITGSERTEIGDSRKYTCLYVLKANIF